MLGRVLDGAAPGRRFQSYTTRAFARVYRFGADPVDLTGHVEHGHIEGAASILSASTTKSLALSGSFTLRIHAAKGFDVKKEVRNGDWISIWFQRNDKRFHGMLGNIDSVRETSAVRDGATTTEFLITGRDAGKVIEKAEVWFNEYCDFGSNVGGKIFGGRMNYIPGGSPDAVVENLLDAFLGSDGTTGGSHRWPRGLKSRMGDFFVQGLKMRVLGNTRKNETFDVGDGAILTGNPLLRGELINEISLFQPAQGTRLSAMLAQWSNPLLNEMFIDSYVEDDGESPVEAPRPMLFLRERPFPNILEGRKSPWWSLPTCRVRRSEIDTMDLGSSDAERINLIMLYARDMVMTQTDQYAAYPPIMDIEDARNHGLYRWERSIDFAGVGSNGTAKSWGEEIDEWNKLIASWYGLNHEWLTGTATFKWLLGEARVGQRFVVEGQNDKDRTQAYIEGVTQAVNYPSSPSTTLSLTRGFVGDDNELMSAVQEKASRFVLPPSSPARVGA